MDLGESDYSDIITEISPLSSQAAFPYPLCNTKGRTNEAGGDSEHFAFVK